jgi:YggT family protein
MNYTVVRLVSLLFDAMTLVILLDVIGSWVVALRVRLPDWGYNILRMVRSVTNVFLGPIRRLIPSIGGLDISPIIALVVIDLLRRFVVGTMLR